ncbi:MAG: hypothetical protein H0T51_08395, partial [Pirellulales bacterium]|nr:hypothetical protein [Pirellulales bacterium]
MTLRWATAGKNRWGGPAVAHFVQDGTDQADMARERANPLNLLRTVTWIAATVILAELLSGAGAHAQNPSTIYVYDPDQGSFERNSLMASLAGVAARTAPEVAFGRQFSSAVSDPEFWVDQFIASNPGTSKS